MPTKGNPVVKCRLDVLTLARIEAELAVRNSGKRKRKLTVSQWIRDAIKLKLDAAKRGRRPRNSGQRRLTDDEYDQLQLEQAELDPDTGGLILPEANSGHTL